MRYPLSEIMHIAFRMESIFAISLAIAIVYFILKFGEMRLISKEERPMKLMLRDTIAVYLSSVVGMYVVDQLGD
ncbi:MAG: hypothetical protein ACW97O_13675, partial [Candidatus Thorarchaeota archaeon]